MKTAVPQVINGFEEASSGSRLVARIIDSVIAWLVFLPMGFLSILILQMIFPTLGNNPSIDWIGFAFAVLLIIVYDTILHAYFGKTLGKKILKLRVMNIHGENLGIGISFARAILLYISILVVAFLTFATASIFGWFILIGLRKYQRYPHDRLVNSYVVHEVKLTQEQSQTRYQATPLADLERLHLAGMITDDEYQKKVKELSK